MGITWGDDVEGFTRVSKKNWSVKKLPFTSQLIVKLHETHKKKIAANMALRSADVDVYEQYIASVIWEVGC